MHRGPPLNTALAITGSTVAFWNRKKHNDLERHLTEVSVMCGKLLQVAGVDFDRAPQLEQALVGTFYFGMLQTHGMLHQLSPADIREIALAAYKEQLHYTDDAAAQAVQECINATEPTYHPGMNAILHRGIDGHRQYVTGDFDGLSTNIRSVLDHYRK
jgi:hypothetical protein